MLDEPHPTFIVVDRGEGLPSKVGVSSSRPVRLERRSLPDADWTVVNEMPITLPVPSLVETLLERPRGSWQAAEIVERSLRLEIVDAGELDQALRPFKIELGLFPAGDSLVDYYLELYDKRFS